MPSLRSSLRRRPFAALILLILLLLAGYAARAATDRHPAAPHPVALSTLPVQARQTVTLIQHGGPYPYPEDGSVYDNRNRRLPAEPLGYYHEYTVPTPGDPDRGERRIVIGRNGTYYWTANHYASFLRIDLTG
ncbi:MAG: ribonuclease domain-containing protein [Jatrophihabitantaceae bacterium]